MTSGGVFVLGPTPSDVVNPCLTSANKGGPTDFVERPPPCTTRGCSASDAGSTNTMNFEGGAKNNIFSPTSRPDPFFLSFLGRAHLATRNDARTRQELRLRSPERIVNLGGLGNMRPETGSWPLAGGGWFSPGGGKSLVLLVIQTLDGWCVSKVGTGVRFGALVQECYTKERSPHHRS